jgi:hypothetical protein
MYNGHAVVVRAVTNKNIVRCIPMRNNADFQAVQRMDIWKLKLIFGLKCRTSRLFSPKPTGGQCVCFRFVHNSGSSMFMAHVIFCRTVRFLGRGAAFTVDSASFNNLSPFSRCRSGVIEKQANNPHFAMLQYAIAQIEIDSKGLFDTFFDLRRIWVFAGCHFRKVVFTFHNHRL